MSSFLEDSWVVRRHDSKGFKYLTRNGGLSTKLAKAAMMTRDNARSHCEKAGSECVSLAVASHEHREAPLASGAPKDILKWFTKLGYVIQSADLAAGNICIESVPPLVVWDSERICQSIERMGVKLDPEAGQRVISHYCPHKHTATIEIVGLTPDVLHPSVTAEQNDSI